ncbi:MAG: serine/threonine protein kinase, partial [Bradymonadia bacterium]
MICFRCGHQVAEPADACSNCGQVFGETRKINRTVTSFKALELRKSRLDASSEESLLPSDDKIAGRYEIDTLLGRGPLGQVYKARDLETGRFVALKALSPKLYESASDRAHLLEALDEAGRHSATRVLRPQVIEHGDLILCRSMFVTGISLSKVIRQRRSRGSAFTLDEIFPRIRQLHEAVADLYADKAHGLLKPENIILLPDGLRLTDYGLAQGISPTILAESQREAGTADYMAPEVIDGEQKATVHSDIYSMGVIFAEMLTNAPWNSEVGLDEQLRKLFDRPEKVDRLVTFIQTATAVELEERFSGLAAFGASLSDLLSREAAEAEGPTTSQSMPANKVLLTVQDMPSLRPNLAATPDPELTAEVEQIDSNFLPSSVESSGSAEAESVEYVLSGSNEVISDEADFLERVPTKVEATHTNARVPLERRTPTGVMPIPEARGLSSNKLFFPLLLGVVLIGGGGFWWLLSMIESTGKEPKIQVSQTTPNEKSEKQENKTSLAQSTQSAQMTNDAGLGANSEAAKDVASG